MYFVRYYQGLNLLQIFCLHLLPQISSLYIRLAVLAVMTSPWLIRHLFPVNSFRCERNLPLYARHSISRSFIFSDNWTKHNPGVVVSLLYRLKKSQYMLYKHFLLHGLNITVAISRADFIETDWFRLFWVSLNTSYVMEFFMQTLVKKVCLL